MVGLESDDIWQRRNLYVSLWRQRDVRTRVRVCTYVAKLTYKGVLGILIPYKVCDV